jgi:hypothetical protein
MSRFFTRPPKMSRTPLSSVPVPLTPAHQAMALALFGHSVARLHATGWSKRRRRGQTIPIKTKLCQANPNKIGWICLVLFVRIGTYQWVTAIPNKIFSPPFPRRQAPCKARFRF